MDVLSFKSENVEISASTAADMARCWQRFRARVRENAMTYCDYRSTIPGTLQLVTAPSFSLRKIGETSITEWKELPPVFYETATYNISIWIKGVEEAPRVLHKLKEVTELFTATKMTDNGWWLSAPISFLNEPGVFDLTFRFKPNGKPERTETFTFRVVSPKLDTKDDYNHILSDINSHYHEIIFQYLTMTFQTLDRGGKSGNDVVWLSIFHSIAENYLKWVKHIADRPQFRQSRRVNHDRADRIKHWGPRMEERYAELKAEGRLEQEYFRHEEIFHTYDTRENRFVKFTLERIGKRLSAIVVQIKEKDERAKESDKISSAELSELENYALEIRKLGNAKLFRRLRGAPLRSESLVLQKRTGYAQVYKYWLLLQKGIELFEGASTIGVRPVWELYELWCFLKMRQMVADILGLSFGNPEEITEVPMPMLKPFEDNKQEHIVYYNCADGSSVRLHYQHTYNRRSGEVHTATTENRPDIVLTIVRADGFELTYLFDAKYRLRDDERLNRDDWEEVEKFGGADSPPSDALNQMHRYRDAIYYGSDRQSHSAKEIIGGYILFPGRDRNEAVREKFFYKSIKEVNIGAFPLLPDAKDPNSEGTLLYEFLTQILTAPSVADHLESAIPQKGLSYHDAFQPASSDLVLVGYYKGKQLEFIRRNKLYYVPAALGRGSINLVSGFERTKYLLLHGNEGRFLLPLSGEGPKFFPRTVLESMGFEPTGDYYLGFEIRSLDPVDGVDIDGYALERAGKKHRYTPYFTTFERLTIGSGG